MRESLNVLKYSFIVLAGIAIIAGFFFKEGTFSKKLEYADDITLQSLIGDMEPTDPALIGYNEIKTLKINLNTLHAIAVSADDKIYVTGDSVLVVFKRDGQEISRLTFEKSVRCITVSPGGRIYLGMTDHVRVLNSDGLRSSEWEKYNPDALITSIAATDTDVFVADAGNKIVLRYDPSGKLLGIIGKRNIEKGEIGFVVPSPYFDVAIGYEGLLWIVNSGRHALENYTLDGQLRSSWERTSIGLDGFCGCCNPTHMAILPNGYFVTSEKGLPRVKVHDQTGEFHTVVASTEQFTEGTVGLDLAVDSQERILVLDPTAGIVRIFIKKHES